MTHPLDTAAWELRHERAGFSIVPAPYTADKVPVPPDYAGPTLKIQRAMFHLDEALPSAQKERSETAYQLLREGFDELGAWLRARGVKV